MIYEPTQLKSLTLSTDMYTAGQISDMIDDSLPRCGQTCTIEDETAIAIGSECSSLSEYCVSEGQKSVAGSYAYRFINVDPLENTIYLDTTDDLNSSELIDKQFSVKFSNNYDHCGRILAVDNVNKVLSCTDVPLMRSTAWHLSATTYLTCIAAEVNVEDRSLDISCDSYQYSHYTSEWKVGECFGVEIIGTYKYETPNSFTYVGKIESISKDSSKFTVHLTFDSLHGITQEQMNHIRALGTVSLKPSMYFEVEEFDRDQFYVWFPTKPLIGDLKIGAFACVIGEECTAQQLNSHSEGKCTTADGKYSHAEGLSTTAAYASHAEGIQVYVESHNSHGEGAHLSVTSHDTFAWNGCYDWYNVHRGHTFNINPQDGYEGFYIGHTNLKDIISSDISSQTKDLKLSVETLDEKINQELVLEKNKYINSSGVIVSYTGSKCGIISASIKQLKGKYINASTVWSNICMNVYNQNDDLLGFIGRPSDYGSSTAALVNCTVDEILAKYPTADHVIIGSIGAYPTINNTLPNSVLDGKKWLACGDSFTYGGFEGVKDADTWDPIRSMWKTYPWHIANRNSMNVQIKGAGGWTMENKSLTSTTAFVSFLSNNIRTLSSDIATADYITFAFGLCGIGVDSDWETFLSDSVIAGVPNDDPLKSNSVSSFYGAYNNVLSTVLSVNPAIKIGIIGSDSWFPTYVDEACKNIAQWWGIPYLSLKSDPTVPALISKTTINPYAQQKRNSALKVKKDDDGHPSPLGQKYRSTIIENYLKSL